MIKKVGLNFDLTENKMETCLKNNETQDEILNERISAQKKYKIELTPTIIVNEKKYLGSIGERVDKKIKHKVDEIWRKQLEKL